MGYRLLYIMCPDIQDGPPKAMSHGFRPHVLYLRTDQSGILGEPPAFDIKSQVPFPADRNSLGIETTVSAETSAEWDVNVNQ